jgi:hypothetical protein
MYQKAALPKTVRAPHKTTNAVPAPIAPSSSKTGSPKGSDGYAKLRKLLEANRLDEALKVARAHSDAPTRNALGVCLMRMGRSEEAVRIYRTLILDSTGLFFRDQVPTVFKTNFAFALMLSGRIEGGINILTELKDDEHPSVQPLRLVVDQWKAKLSFTQKLLLKLGIEPNCPVRLDFPPGELL